RRLSRRIGPAYRRDEAETPDQIWKRRTRTDIAGETVALVLAPGLYWHLDRRLENRWRARSRVLVESQPGSRRAGGGCRQSRGIHRLRGVRREVRLLSSRTTRRWRFGCACRRATARAALHFFGGDEVGLLQSAMRRGES